ncbi:MAG: ABC transporter permease, partial [Synergistaceae bacterium]|nr:ABC transporter permease [Synergistaceae bacterium]
MYDPLMFMPISEHDRAETEIIRPSKTYWQDVRSRLRRDKLAMFGLS